MGLSNSNSHSPSHHNHNRDYLSSGESASTFFLKQKVSFSIKIGIVAAMINFGYWIYIFLFIESLRPSLVYWWLPLSPVFLMFFSLYVDRDIRRLVEDVNYLDK